MSFAAQARSRCPESPEQHDRVWFCLTCRLLELRLTPVSEVLRDVLADADLTLQVNWKAR